MFLSEANGRIPELVIWKWFMRNKQEFLAGLLLFASAIALAMIGIFAPVYAEDEALVQPRTIFVIVMENQNWSQIYGNPAAPYINSLLSQGAYAENYYNPPGLHPS